MLEQRRLYRDCFALALLALGVFLSLALVSYQPADRPPTPGAPLHWLNQRDWVIDPAHAKVDNWCGHWGAFAADALFSWLGVGAYYLVVSLGVLDFQLLRRREIDSPALRMLGWIASLAGVTAIA